ncbi:hypothetical protein PVAP13_3KG121981 [Panicum virgatum]|uniref:Uncharacterized protein n=1 Tax=Panicum virgatum TaxID=38727 RepID=A0A8T0UU87_PANVG|nr:hypothetical protein PVAP13_3KG121981 [Panicum virgatum]
MGGHGPVDLAPTNIFATGAHNAQSNLALTKGTYNARLLPRHYDGTFANHPPGCPANGLLVASRGDASVPFSQAEETAGGLLYGSSSPVDEQLGSRAPTLSTIPTLAARAVVFPRAIFAKPAGRRMSWLPTGRRPRGAGSCVVAAGEGGGRTSCGGRRGPPQRRRARLRPSPTPPLPFYAPVAAAASTGLAFRKKTSPATSSTWTPSQ